MNTYCPVHPPEQVQVGPDVISGVKAIQSTTASKSCFAERFPGPRTDRRTSARSTRTSGGSGRIEVVPRLRTCNSIPRSTASREQAELMFPLPPTNRTFNPLIQAANQPAAMHRPRSQQPPYFTPSFDSSTGPSSRSSARRRPVRSARQRGAAAVSRVAERQQEIGPAVRGFGLQPGDHLERIVRRRDPVVHRRHKRHRRIADDRLGRCGTANSRRDTGPRRDRRASRIRRSRRPGSEPGETAACREWARGRRRRQTPPGLAWR